MHHGRLYVARRRFRTTTAVVRHQRGGRHGTAQLGSFCVLCGVVVEGGGKKNPYSLAGIELWSGQ
jgi:hypothetical protein